MCFRFGGVTAQGEFLDPDHEAAVRMRFSTSVSTEMMSAGPPRLYPRAMKITPAPTSPRVNMPIESARRSLTLRSR